MTTTTINGNTYVFLQVPEGCTGKLSRYPFSGWWFVMDSKELNADKIWVGKSHERFEHVGKAADLTESQWAGIVDSEESEEGTVYESYTNILPYHLVAVSSGYTLLASLSLNPQTTLILKKV